MPNSDDAMLAARRASAPAKINNCILPAGSPMYYYCASCNHLTAIKPEGWYRDPPPKHCDWCVKHGFAT